jgi:tight adherence protein B
MPPALTPILLAAALLTWPANPARRRLRALTPPATTQKRRTPIPLTALIPAAIAVAAWPPLGPAGALSAALLAAVIRSTILRRQATRTHFTSQDALTESLRSLVAELRTGTNPVTAAESAAEEAPAAVAALLRSAASTTRMGGIPAVPPDATGAQIVHAWHLATHHGLPLADILNSTRHDLEHRTRAARQADARMAGPRASATVLATLPAVALLLGHTTGTDPLSVLADTPLGQLLLLTGTSLAALGLHWSKHITRVDHP